MAGSLLSSKTCGEGLVLSMTRGESHVNMLKEFRVRRPVESSFWASPDGVDDMDSKADVPLWNDTSEEGPSIGEQLSTTQRKELGEFC